MTNPGATFNSASKLTITSLLKNEKNQLEKVGLVLKVVFALLNIIQWIWKQTEKALWENAYFGVGDERRYTEKNWTERRPVFLFLVYATDLLFESGKISYV